MNQNNSKDIHPNDKAYTMGYKQGRFDAEMEHHQELQKREEMVEAKDNAYHERNLLVQALTRIYPAYLACHDENDESWEKDWMWIVYINIPVRTKVVSGDQHNHVPESRWFETKEWQVSWHIHDKEKELFDHLEVRDNNWDGHSTDEKYERLKALTQPNNK